MRKTRAGSLSSSRASAQDSIEGSVKLKLHYGDLTDSTNLFHIISSVRPDEIYNLGAMSHVMVSFEMSARAAPEHTRHTRLACGFSLFQKDTEESAALSLSLV